MPDWMETTTYSDGTLLITGVPSDDDIGNQVMQLVATDPHGGSADTIFELVVESNHPVVADPFDD